MNNFYGLNPRITCLLYLCLVRSSFLWSIDYVEHVNGDAKA
jgi:hypothetical protein